MEWHNHAKWSFHFCQSWESSCPGIKAFSAGQGWWHRGHCLCSSGCPEPAPAKLLTQHCPPKSECTCSQFHHITGYSLFTVISGAVLRGGGSFSRHCCLWVSSASLLLEPVPMADTQGRCKSKCLAMFSYQEAGGYPASGWCFYI